MLSQPSNSGRRTDGSLEKEGVGGDGGEHDPDRRCGGVSGGVGDGSGVAAGGVSVHGGQIFRTFDIKGLAAGVRGLARFGGRFQGPEGRA